MNLPLLPALNNLSGTTECTTDVSLLDQKDSEEESLASYPDFQPGPFEGVEKRLILDFKKEVLGFSLRKFPVALWQTILDSAACHILSSVENTNQETGEACTAFLLSESSLFVYDSRVILKTCGTTTPLLCIPILISCINSFKCDLLRNNKSCIKNDIMRTDCCCNVLNPNSRSDIDLIQNNNQLDHNNNNSIIIPDDNNTTSSAEEEDLVVCRDNRQCMDYCHYNNTTNAINYDAQDYVSWMLFTHLQYCFPEKQKYPHRSFAEETHYIHMMFPSSFITSSSIDENACYDSSSNNNNNSDTNNGYLTHCSLKTSEQKEFFICGYQAAPSVFSCNTSIKLKELMMLGIEPNCVDKFARREFNNNNNNNNETIPQDKVALDSLVFDGQDKLDEFWFQPCGYSCNILSSNYTVTDTTSTAKTLNNAESLNPANSCYENHTEEDAITKSNSNPKDSLPSFATIHISPETETSYASVEWNFHQERDLLFISSAIFTFKPSNIHHVEICLMGHDDDDFNNNGTHQYLKSKGYKLLHKASVHSRWFHIAHAEYNRDIDI